MSEIATAAVMYKGITTAFLNMAVTRKPVQMVSNLRTLMEL